MSTQRFVNWGPHEVSTATEIGKELLKHERPLDWNPRDHQFPKMLYKAHKIDGRVQCMDIYPKQFAFATLEQYRMACEAVDAFNQSCQLTVDGPEMQSRAYNEGWRESPNEASQVIFDEQAKLAQLNGEMEYRNRNMSPKAKAESAAYQETTPEHVTEIPESRTVKPHPASKEARAARAAAAAQRVA